jgi:hypothetical protein
MKLVETTCPDEQLSSPQGRNLKGNRGNATSFYRRLLPSGRRKINDEKSTRIIQDGRTSMQKQLAKVA